MPVNTTPPVDDPPPSPAPGTVKVRASVTTTWKTATDGPQGACLRPDLPLEVIAWEDTAKVLQPKAGDACPGDASSTSATALENAKSAGKITIATKDQPAVDAAAAAESAQPVSADPVAPA